MPLPQYRSAPPPDLTPIFAHNARLSAEGIRGFANALQHAVGAAKNIYDRKKVTQALMGEGLDKGEARSLWRTYGMDAPKAYEAQKKQKDYESGVFTMRRERLQKDIDDGITSPEDANLVLYGAMQGGDLARQTWDSYNSEVSKRRVELEDRQREESKARDELYAQGNRLTASDRAMADEYGVEPYDVAAARNFGPDTSLARKHFEGRRAEEMKPPFDVPTGYMMNEEGTGVTTIPGFEPKAERNPTKVVEGVLLEQAQDGSWSKVELPADVQELVSGGGEVKYEDLAEADKKLVKSIGPTRTLIDSAWNMLDQGFNIANPDDRNEMRQYYEGLVLHIADVFGRGANFTEMEKALIDAIQGGNPVEVWNKFAVGNEELKERLEYFSGLMEQRVRVVLTGELPPVEHTPAWGDQSPPPLSADNPGIGSFTGGNPF